MNCPTCSVEFIPKRYSRKQQRFCSLNCFVKRGRTVGRCAHCGKSGVRFGRKFCSHPCFAKNRSGSMVDKFNAQVDKSGPNGCFVWTGRKFRREYGLFHWGGKARLAHRVAWALANGDPGDECVLHKCDNPPCVNPEHLFLGTRGDNNRDAYAKGRHTQQLIAKRLITRRKRDKNGPA